jgi:L-asparagine oxygenase
MTVTATSVEKRGTGTLLRLVEDERRATASVLDELPRVAVHELDARLIAEARPAAELLPSVLVEAVGVLRDSPDEDHLLVRRLPSDPHPPPTPSDGRPAQDKRTRRSEWLLILLASLLGGPIAYAEEKDGLLVHDVCPIRGRELRQENSGSTYFELHTENAFHSHRPDFVLLTCLRPDHLALARTLVASLRDALPHLSEREVELLRRPLYRTRMPSSFAGPNGEVVATRPLPVVESAGDGATLRVDAHNTEAVTPEAAGALAQLVDSLERELHGWALAPGDTLLVDNRRAVHARTAFTPRYDGRDRWLQRTYAVADLAPSAAIRPDGEHVCVGLPRDEGGDADG